MLYTTGCYKKRVTVEVGIGRARDRSRSDLARCSLLGMWDCCGQDFLFYARTSTNPSRWPTDGTTLFLCFLVQNCQKSKKQHKTRATPA